MTTSFQFERLISSRDLFSRGVVSITTPLPLWLRASFFLVGRQILEPRFILAITTICGETASIRLQISRCWSRDFDGMAERFLLSSHIYFGSVFNCTVPRAKRPDAT